MNGSTRSLVLVVAAVLFVGVQVQAGALITDVTLGGFSSRYRDVPGSGAFLPGDFHPQGLITETNPWLTYFTDHAPFITFVFGGEYCLESIQLWNFVLPNNTYARYGICDTYISVYTESGGWRTLRDEKSGLGYFSFVHALREGPEGQIIEFGDGVMASAIRFDVICNFVDGVFFPQENQFPLPESPVYTGLNAIKFYRVVPEPAMMNLLILSGLALLRRKRA